MSPARTAVSARALAPVLEDVLEQGTEAALGTAVQQVVLDVQITVQEDGDGVVVVQGAMVVQGNAEMLAPLVQDVVVGVLVVRGVQIIVLQLVIVDVHHLALLDVAIQLELGV